MIHDTWESMMMDEPDVDDVPEYDFGIDRFSATFLGCLPYGDVEGVLCAVWKEDDGMLGILCGGEDEEDDYIITMCKIAQENNMVGKRVGFLKQGNMVMFDIETFVAG